MNGDISIEKIREEEYKSFAPEHREWLLFSSIKSLNKTCHSRTASCRKMFVVKKNVIWAAVVLAAFLIGAGYLQAHVIIPELIKAAIGG